MGSPTTGTRSRRNRTPEPAVDDHGHLRELARRFGTPAYVYDLAALRTAATALADDLPAGTERLYSLKANPHPAVVRELAAHGLGAEVSSTGELDIALAAGHPAERILYTGPGKTRTETRAALEAGVVMFSVESLGDRDRLARACAETGTDAEYLVRLNGPRGSQRGSLRMTGRPTAFGTDVTAEDDLARMLAPSGRTRPIGTHTFSASNVNDPDALALELEQAVATTARVVAQTGFTPELLDLGGGFSAPSGRPGGLVRHPLLAAALSTALDDHFAGWRRGRPRVVVESGRYLTATAGTLLTTVVDVKESGGRTFAVLDAGVNALGGMSGLGRLMTPGARPYPVGPGDRATGTDESGPGTPRSAGPVSLVGPLCTPLDVLNGAAAMEAPRPGQLLAVPNVGAYGLTASLLGFLSRPAPVEIVVDGERLVSARRLVLQPMEVEAHA
ncbi:type III PLP-dependent enzyme [Streptomyces sp. NPDC051569]|uniref:type III PLP-dependent enzyme n=1 Tax=Streptomyces sp. NPDC051569 TaxID=3365661 RepID=UPI00379E5FB7